MIDRIIELLDSIDKKDVTVDTTRYSIAGVPIPSATQILGKCIAEQYIINWANYLGFKRQKYKDVIGLAATIGTDAHNSVEVYLRDGVECSNIGYLSFRIWWDELNRNHQVAIIGIEEALILPYCAGTYDILLSIDGKIYLVDLKTSTHITYKHFIQLAAYRHMLYVEKNINVDGCLILQLDKEVPSFEEFILDFHNPEHYAFIEHCSFSFLSMALSYYNINKAESMFKQIF